MNWMRCMMKNISIKRIIAYICIIVLCISITGCTANDNGTVQKRNYYAIVSLPNGEIIKGEATDWGMYPSKSTMYVVIDCKKIVTNSTNIAVIYDVK